MHSNPSKFGQYLTIIQQFGALRRGIHIIHKSLNKEILKEGWEGGNWKWTLCALQTFTNYCIKNKRAKKKKVFTLLSRAERSSLLSFGSFLPPARILDFYLTSFQNLKLQAHERPSSYFWMLYWWLSAFSFVLFFATLMKLCSSISYLEKNT